ncbi:MAG: LamG domain-containing protein [Planctomycetaceae bacterium]
MKVVTLLAWANVQSLSRWQNSLLSADSETPGSIHWQLTKRGQLRLAIARDLGGAQSDWEAVESQPFLTEGHYRQWMLLATTFDGTTIRHYANGRQVGTGASFTPDALHIGTAEIGNWLGDTRRELHAILDEFVVLNRVLREEEIVEIHRYGKP